MPHKPQRKPRNTFGMCHQERVAEYKARGLCDETAEIMAEYEGIFEESKSGCPKVLRNRLLHEEYKLSEFATVTGYRTIESLKKDNATDIIYESENEVKRRRRLTAKKRDMARHD